MLTRGVRSTYIPTLSTTCKQPHQVEPDSTQTSINQGIYVINIYSFIRLCLCLVCMAISTIFCTSRHAASRASFLAPRLRSMDLAPRRA